jgi:hypothetical protein
MATMLKTTAAYTGRFWIFFTNHPESWHLMSFTGKQNPLYQHTGRVTIGFAEQSANPRAVFFLPGMATVGIIRWAAKRCRKEGLGA